MLLLTPHRQIAAEHRSGWLLTAVVVHKRIMRLVASRKILESELFIKKILRSRNCILISLKALLKVLRQVLRLILILLVH